MTIVPFGPAHVDGVARLHRETLTGLLSALGPSAVRAFYAGAAMVPETRAFVALDRETPALVGFVMGALHPSELRSEIARKNRLAVLAGILRGVASRPSLLGWLLRSRKGPDEGIYDTQAPELIYLAVAPGQRGAGTGRGLVGTFDEAMKKEGVAAYELSVDDTNKTAIAFYEKLGFRLAGRYREFGAWHRRYRRTLAGPGAGAESREGH